MISFLNNKNMKKIILLVLAIYFIQSCADSNVDISNENFHSTVANPTKVLSKIGVTEVGSIAYEINYNWSAGKLISVVASNASFSYSLEYTGNDLTKVVQTLGQGPQLVSRISNLVYSNKKLTSINGTEVSATSGTSEFVTAITYNGNNPSNITRTFTQNGSTTASENVNLTFTNNNLTNVNYFFGPTTNQQNIILALSNYDAKPNPLNTLPVAFSISNSFLNEDSFSILGLSLNNYKTSTNNFLGGSTQQNTTYTYSLDGFPTKSVNSDYIFDYQYIILP